MSNIDFQNGFALGVSSKGQTQGVAPNPLEYAVSVANVYQKVSFPTDYNLILALPNCTTFTYVCYQSTGLKTITFKDLSENSNMFFGYAFRDCKTTEIVDLENKTIKISLATDTFRGMVMLKEIKGTLDLTEITNVNNMFEGCSALETVRFKENSIKLSISFAKCPKLSSATVQSIVDGLATVETAQTLTLNSAVAVSDTQKATIQSKGWTLVQ